MTRTHVGRETWSVTGAVLLSAATLLAAAPAAADPTDDAFIAALEKRGIVFADDNAAIALARGVCAGLDRGQTPASLMLSLGRDLSAREAGFFIGVSVASYCPQHKGDTGVSMPPPGD